MLGGAEMASGVAAGALPVPCVWGYSDRAVVDPNEVLDDPNSSHRSEGIIHGKPEFCAEGNDVPIARRSVELLYSDDA